MPTIYMYNMMPCLIDARSIICILCSINRVCIWLRHQQDNCDVAACGVWWLSAMESGPPALPDWVSTSIR